jgi:hypothetical protein
MMAIGLRIGLRRGLPPLLTGITPLGWRSWRPLRRTLGRAMVVVHVEFEGYEMRKKSRKVDKTEQIKKNSAD